MHAATITLVPLAGAAPQHLVAELLQRWPAHAPAPTFHTLRDDERPDGVILFHLENSADEPELIKRVDDLDDPRRTLVVLAPPERLDRAARLGPSVIALPNTPGDTLAASLAALTQQRAALEPILGEHDAVQRSHLGLQREMQQIREELQLAARVQREFMPKKLPETPGLQVASLFRPCGYVSGDIFDVVRLDEHHVGFFIADAVGHGVPAALMTMVLSHGMRMKEIRGSEYRIIPPAEVLQRCNDALIAGNLPSDRFLTAAYGVIDVRTHAVELAGAGHPPPVLVRPGASRAIETEGPLLGVFPGAEFDAVSFTIDPDETLVIYSDGFETAFPEGPENNPAEPGFSRRLPTTRYLDHFQSLTDALDTPGGLTSALAQLAHSVDSQSGSLHQVDDITALAFARAPKPALVNAA